jgi:hypothetical protein
MFPHFVMAGLDPAISRGVLIGPWMSGSSPVMTEER